MSSMHLGPVLRLMAPMLCNRSLIIRWFHGCHAMVSSSELAKLFFLGLWTSQIHQTFETLPLPPQARSPAFIPAGSTIYCKDYRSSYSRLHRSLIFSNSAGLHVDSSSCQSWSPGLSH